VVSASAHLARKVKLALPAYGAPLDSLLQHPSAHELYPPFLTVAYHISRSMVPLMEAAFERALELAPGDPVAAGLASYLERHILEEMHSDEPGDAVVDDLAALGLDRAEVRALPLTPQIAELVAGQQRWITEDHPVAVLGFLELEAHQADRATVEELIEKTGLPRPAFSQLQMHARLDLVHAKDLHRVLDSLPLEPQHEELIGLSALQTMFLVTDAFLDVIEDARRHQLVPPLCDRGGITQVRLDRVDEPRSLDATT
jgi:hypothetical protein